MSKPLKVADPYRTNQLSIQPGGVIVVVEYADGKILEYDKVKNPSAYIRSIERRDGVIRAYIKE